jgi:tetratricopeptide (TPR) repeat protein
MYLRGSKMSMTRRRRRPSNPIWVFTLLVLIAAAWYFNKAVVPTLPAMFEPTPTATRSPESFINEAEAFYQAGKLKQAIDSYKQAILANPKNPAIYIAMAQVMVFNGQYDDARKAAEDALILNPANSMAYAVKGWALDKTGDYLEAEGSVNQALQIDPNNALAYAYMAEILLDRGSAEDLDQAIADSRKAQSLAPNLLETHRIRGYVLYTTQNFADAITEYKAALAVNDKIWDLHYFLGTVYWSMGVDSPDNYSLAVQEFLEAGALNPTNPDILTMAARTELAAGQYGKAAQYAEQAVKIDPTDPGLHAKLGYYYYKNQEYDKASVELSLFVRGGTATDGTVVKGVPLAPGSAADNYAIYSLALSKASRCADAVPVAQLVLQNIASDQIAYDNAQTAIQACQASAAASAPTSAPTATP